jgi:hypothetical protein
MTWQRKVALSVGNGKLRETYRYVLDRHRDEDDDGLIFELEENTVRFTRYSV